MQLVAENLGLVARGDRHSDVPCCCVCARNRVLEWSRKWQYWVDKSVVYGYSRWAGLGVALVLFGLRIYLLNGWFIVAYGLGIFLLNLLIGFISPQASGRSVLVRARCTRFRWSTSCTAGRAAWRRRSRYARFEWVRSTPSPSPCPPLPCRTVAVSALYPHYPCLHFDRRTLTLAMTYNYPSKPRTSSDPSCGRCQSSSFGTHPSPWRAP